MRSHDAGVIKRAVTSADLDAARKLFREYQQELNVSLCFQEFESELSGLPGKYAPPKGGLFLLQPERDVIGCVAFRKLSEKICEMKRLYVRPAFRKGGQGRALAEFVLWEASTSGYEEMRLDTLEVLQPALMLYRKLGFFEIPPYYSNPLPGVIYMAKALNAHAGTRVGGRTRNPGEREQH